MTLRPDGAAEWSAAIDCAPPVVPVSLLGAYVAFARDHDLDGVTDAVDTSWISPADCGEAEAGRIRMRRRFSDPPSVLRAMLRAATDTAPSPPSQTHATLTKGIGSLLAIARYCARPKNGEPEWIAVRNEASRSLSLKHVRLEGRALQHVGMLESGALFVAGADTTELRLWQPGARLVGLSSWASLRNTGDTLRIVLAGSGGHPDLVLDSVIYGAAGFDGEACASLATEGSGAAASGFELVLSGARGRLSGSGLVAEVRVSGTMPYDLDLYDLDGAPVCRLARAASGSGTYTISSATCARLRGRAGTYILHLRPRGAPGVRKPLRLAP